MLNALVAVFLGMSGSSQMGPGERMWREWESKLAKARSLKCIAHLTKNVSGYAGTTTF